MRGVFFACSVIGTRADLCIEKVKDRDDILIKARFHTTDSKLGTRGKEGIDVAAYEGLSKTHLARGKGTN